MAARRRLRAISIRSRAVCRSGRRVGGLERDRSSSSCDELVGYPVHFVNAFIAERKLVVASWAREHGLHRIALLEAYRTAVGVVWSNGSRLDTVSKLQL